MNEETKSNIAAGCCAVFIIFYMALIVWDAATGEPGDAVNIWEVRR